MTTANPTNLKDEPTVEAVAAGTSSPLSRSGRAPYKAPRLRHLGSVRELTLGGTMGIVDGFGTKMAM